MMLKRFLKFFKGQEDVALPEFDGSYLDFLLMHSHEGVARELEQCPGHDPLLLVIAEILRVSMEGVWSETIRRPLRDQHSPTGPAPAPPPPPPVSEVVEEVDGEEFEVLEEDSDLIEEIVDQDDFEEVAEDAEGVEVDDDEVDTSVVSEAEVLSQIDGSLLAAEETVAADEKVGADQKPRVDQREVLQAGRVFLGMLIENDRLPLELQLGVEETMLARDLLVGYFVGHEDFEEKAQRLLRVVEQKFSEGLFSQARILLQLFQTDRDTRIRNDRNIFYEDMIQRLGIKRRHTVSQELVAAWGELASPDDDSADVEPEELLTWLAERLFVKMHVFTRDMEAVKGWTEVGGLSELPGATENLLRYLPPRHWRQAHGNEAGLKRAIRAHINIDTLATYLTNQTRTCYFVLRAVGDTGLEGYLDSYFDFTSQQLDVNATAMLPELYRRSMGDADMMKSVFDDLYARTLKLAAEDVLESWTDAQVDAAIDDAMEYLRRCDVNEVPPGSYDLGGFVFDRLFDVSYPSREFAFKLHRLT
jgi:hypothetical protein